MKNLFFLSGLPRAGSTLLSDLLAQNDAFHCSPTSGLIDMLNLIKNNWNSNEHFKASFDINMINDMITGTAQGFYQSVEADNVIDKSRAWCGSVPLANLLSNNNAKVIVTVRLVVEVIASFEKMYRKNAHNFMLPQEKANQASYATLEGRCENLVSSSGIIGSSYNQILQAMKTGFKSNLLFVDYNRLCIEPEAELKRVYNFLEIDFPEKVHQYTDVISQNYEYEMARGFPQSLHEIRAEVKPQKSDAFEILGKELFEKYSNSEFWNNYLSE
jgi:sulfotransferase